MKKQILLLLVIIVSEQPIRGEQKNYCNFMRSSDQPSIPSTQDQSVQNEDHEGLIPLIKQYSPIIYLHSKEEYLPIKVEEYFTSNQTGLREKKNNSVIIPKGYVTMEKIYNLYVKNKNKDLYYFDINSCIKSGSNPTENKNANGSLSTPIYVLTFTKDNKLYFQFFFYYGYNAPYDIAGLFAPQFIKDYLGTLRGAHEADLEHITIEFDSSTRSPLRIYYGSHGRYEGIWIDWNNKDIQKEGTHPILFAAKGSHGLYPRTGTYIRIFGFCNDITGKGIRWEPIIRRIYLESDSRFNPKTMGWIYHAGDYGKDGVSAVYDSAWFANPAQEHGRPYKDVLFCSESDGYMCKIRKAPFATIPK